MLLFPADTTTTLPRDTAPSMAVWKVELQEPPPLRDRLITSAGVALAGTPDTVPPDAHVMAAAMSEVHPPSIESTRIGWIWACGAAPMTPWALFPTAAIVPATWVPCQLESDGP